jgi:hypothetical protein
MNIAITGTRESYESGPQYPAKTSFMESSSHLDIFKQFAESWVLFICLVDWKQLQLHTLKCSSLHSSVITFYNCQQVHILPSLLSQPSNSTLTSCGNPSLSTAPFVLAASRRSVAASSRNQYLSTFRVYSSSVSFSYLMYFASVRRCKSTTPVVEDRRFWRSQRLIRSCFEDQGLLEL